MFVSSLVSNLKRVWRMPYLNRLPGANARVNQWSLWPYPLQIPAGLFLGLANISCANPFSEFSLSRSLASSLEIQQNADICNGPSAPGRIRSTRSRPPVPRVSGLRAPLALRPTFHRARGSLRPPESQDAP